MIQISSAKAYFLIYKFLFEVEVPLSAQRIVIFMPIHLHMLMITRDFHSHLANSTHPAYPILLSSLCQ